MVRIADADGAVLSETTIEPEWVRTGGTERCGGPSEAEMSVTI